MTDKERRQVATTVDREMYDALVAIRWAKQIDKFSDVVRAALSDYIAKNGKVTNAAKQ